MLLFFLIFETNLKESCRLNGCCPAPVNKSLIKAVFGLCKSISRKYSIFQKCYFLKRKMFSCVWLHFKKFSEKYFLVFGEEEGKDKPRQTQKKEKTARSRSSRDCNRRRDRRSRSTSIAIVEHAHWTIAPLVDRRACSSDDRTARRSTRGAIDDRCSPIWALPSLSLSLSLSPEMI